MTDISICTIHDSHRKITYQTLCSRTFTRFLVHWCPIPPTAFLFFQWYELGSAKQPLLPIPTAQPDTVYAYCYKMNWQLQAQEQRQAVPDFMLAAPRILLRTFLNHFVSYAAQNILSILTDLSVYFVRNPAFSGIKTCCKSYNDIKFTTGRHTRHESDKTTYPIINTFTQIVYVSPFRRLVHRIVYSLHVVLNCCANKIAMIFPKIKR